MKHIKRLYVVSNVNDNELPVYIGDVDEVADFFKTSTKTIYCNVSRKTLVKKKYQIESIEISEVNK